jgi:hypothetical protein
MKQTGTGIGLKAILRMPTVCYPKHSFVPGWPRVTLFIKTFPKSLLTSFYPKLSGEKGSWLHDRSGTEVETTGGEQPIDVAYTIMAFKRFHTVFRDPDYYEKMQASFNWFLGENHLHQIIYNPITGGCYDGLEDHYVNLNQGAESTVSYLMARLTIDAGERERIHEGAWPEEEEMKLNTIYETQFF